MGYGEYGGPGGEDFRCDECFSGKRRAGDAGVGGDWDHQHYAGGGGGPHAGDWIAEGAGSDECEHHVSIFCGGRFSDFAERDHGNCGGGGSDGDVFGSGSGRGIRSAEAGGADGGVGGGIAGGGGSGGGTVSGAAGGVVAAGGGVAEGIEPFSPRIRADSRGSGQNL